MTDLSKYHVTIAVPCMDVVKTDFMASLVALKNNGNASIAIEAGSLVYHSREKLLVSAMDHNADFIFFVDSDMKFAPDTLLRLLQDAVENDLDMVSGLCFRRMYPTSPTMAKTLDYDFDAKTRKCTVNVPNYTDYPRDALFPVACSGLACTLIRMSAICEVIENEKMSPFQPLFGLSEDYSFCIRMKAAKKKMWVDSRIKIGHIGQFVYGEDIFLKQEQEKEGEAE